MKFDTIIIGGGLAGLTAGIALATRGQKVAIVDNGGSSLLFNHANFGLLGRNLDDNTFVDDFAPALSRLNPAHPYSHIGIGNIPALADDVAKLFNDASIDVIGTPGRNLRRITALGNNDRAWLMPSYMLHSESIKSLRSRKVLVVGIAGFLDAAPNLIAESLASLGIDSRVTTTSTDDLRRLRSSSSEMRAANISRILRGDAVDRVAVAINALPGVGDEYSAVLLPEALVPVDASDFARLKSLVAADMLFYPNLGATAFGAMTDRRLKSRFRSLGGSIFKGDKVVAADFDGRRLLALTTQALGQDRLIADNFIFAAGSFFGRGIVNSPAGICEPIFGLDIDAPDGVAWTDDILAPQPIFSAGVATDDRFRALRRGEVVDNLYVVGAALSGSNPAEASGAGIASLSALHVANLISKR